MAKGVDSVYGLLQALNYKQIKRTFHSSRSIKQNLSENNNNPIHHEAIKQLYKDRVALLNLLVIQY
jgi:hypothetical protein